MTYSNMWPRGEWTQRHLNWAMILYSLLAFVPYCVVLVAGVVAEVDAIVYGALVPAFGAVIWCCYLMVWNLRHKGRSLWNLLYILIPYVGEIVFLCVGNRGQLAKRQEGQRSMLEGGKY